jgi:CheY-like chemotaxis protein
MKKIGVLLVDDHTVVRQGLRALLSSEEDIEVVGEAENGRQAVMLAKKSTSGRGGYGCGDAAAQWTGGYASNSQTYARA